MGFPKRSKQKTRKYPSSKEGIVPFNIIVSLLVVIALQMGTQLLRITMFSQVIATELFKLSLNECISHLKKKKPNIKDFNQSDINNAYIKARNIEMVKTIWQIDRSVNLNEFYYPSKIRVESKKIPVESLASFPENSKVVIQG